MANYVYKSLKHEKHGMLAHRMGRLRKFKKDEVDELVMAGGTAYTTRQDQVE